MGLCSVYVTPIHHVLYLTPHSNECATFSFFSTRFHHQNTQTTIRKEALFFKWNICCLCSLHKLPDQWDPHGSPQANLSGPVLPPGTPFPNQPQHRTSVPDSTEGFDLNKPDPYDLYEKSRAIYESRREY